MMTTNDIGKLLSVLLIADAKARSAAYLIEDEGTCCLDMPYIAFDFKKGTRKAKIQEFYNTFDAHLRALGFHGYSSCSGYFVVAGPGMSGMGFKRTAYCQAMAKELTAAGYDSGVHYVMD